MGNSAKAIEMIGQMYGWNEIRLATGLSIKEIAKMVKEMNS